MLCALRRSSRFDDYVWTTCFLWVDQQLTIMLEHRVHEQLKKYSLFSKHCERIVSHKFVLGRTQLKCVYESWKTEPKISFRIRPWDTETDRVHKRMHDSSCTQTHPHCDAPSNARNRLNERTTAPSNPSNNVSAPDCWSEARLSSNYARGINHIQRRVANAPAHPLTCGVIQ